MFYKETDFKEEPLVGEIPKNWDSVDLREVVEIHDSKRIPLSEMERNQRKGKYPYCGANGIIDYIDDYIFDGEFVLLAEDGGSYGRFENTAYIMSERFWVNNHAHVLRAMEGKTTNRFLKHVLDFLDLNPYIVGSTRKKLNQEQMKEIRLPLPHLNEQKAIVAVLGVVDLAVAKTGEVIAKTERLKKGLMQELLTHGIGHKEHKQTPIGKTPKTWQVVKLGNVAEVRGNKSINNLERIAFIPMELISDSQPFAKYEIRKKEDVKSFTYCEAGDLLLAKITPSLENGKQGIVPFDVQNGIALATTEVFPIHCKGIDRLFLFYVLKFSNFRNKIISSMIGTTGRQRASKESVERLEIPLPPFEEQIKIAEILSAVDKKLGLEKQGKTRLERVKLGLMDLLLTGKVRIKED